MKYLTVLRGKTSVNFSENRFFFRLKFSLNLLEYEAKDFINEKKNFCFISHFSWDVSGVSHTATQNFERVFLETRFFKTARTITR